MSDQSARSTPVSRWIWPGLLIAGPAAVIVASVITAYFVLQHPDGLVASDYYKQGKAINAKLSQLDRAHELGMDSLQLTLSDKAVTLRFPSGQDTGPIEVVLAHPVNPDQDIRKTVERDAAGGYQPVPFPDAVSEVKEKRAEVAISYGRPLAPDLTLQSSLGAEYSNIQQDGAGRLIAASEQQLTVNYAPIVGVRWQSPSRRMAAGVVGGREHQGAIVRNVEVPGPNGTREARTVVRWM